MHIVWLGEEVGVQVVVVVVVMGEDVMVMVGEDVRVVVVVRYVVSNVSSDSGMMGLHMLAMCFGLRVCVCVCVCRGGGRGGEGRGEIS